MGCHRLLASLIEYRFDGIGVDLRPNSQSGVVAMVVPKKTTKSLARGEVERIIPIVPNILARTRDCRKISPLSKTATTGAGGPQL